RFLEPHDQRSERVQPGELRHADQRLEEGAVGHAPVGALVLAPLGLDERAVQIQKFASHPHKMRPETRQNKAGGPPPGQTISFERSSRSGGITRSSERRVFRLMTSSNLGGGSMASSPGLAPFTSLSTKVAARKKSCPASTPYETRPPASTYWRAV